MCAAFCRLCDVAGNTGKHHVHSIAFKTTVLWFSVPAEKLTSSSIDAARFRYIFVFVSFTGGPDARTH